MNAINFIKHYGLNTAIRITEDSKNDDFWDTETAFYTDKNSESCVCISELKRVVESIGLVNKLGGIAIAKEKLAYGNSISAMRLSYETTITNRDGTKQNVITGVYLEDLEQAIADYESIESCKCVVTRTYENGTCNKCGMQDMGDDSHIENHISPLCKVGVK